MDVPLCLLRNAIAQSNNLTDTAKRVISSSSKTTIPSLKCNDFSPIHSVTMLEWSSEMTDMVFVYLSQTEAQGSVWPCGLNLSDTSGLKIFKESTGGGWTCKTNLKTSKIRSNNLSRLICTNNMEFQWVSFSHRRRLNLTVQRMRKIAPTSVRN